MNNMPNSSRIDETSGTTDCSCLHRFRAEQRGACCATVGHSLGCVCSYLSDLQLHVDVKVMHLDPPRHDVIIFPLVQIGDFGNSRWSQHTNSTGLATYTTKPSTQMSLAWSAPEVRFPFESWLRCCFHLCLGGIVPVRRLPAYGTRLPILCTGIIVPGI